MDLGWSDADERFRMELGEFLDAHAPPEALDGTERWAAGELVPEWARRWQATLFDHGWMIPSLPPHLGGRDATPTQTAVLLEELARRNVPRSLHFPGYGIAAPSLLQFGTPAQQALAPAAIRGDTVWCIGMSEPDAGSDLASLRTRAAVRDDAFVVTGQKVWTSYAPIADMCLCYVRTDPDQPRHAGISALLVDMGSPGITVRPLRNIGGMSEFAEVHLDEVEVPRDALLGELHGGWKVTQSSLGHERSSMWMEAVARLERAVDDLVVLARRVGRAGDPRTRQRLADAHGRVGCLPALGLRSMARPGPLPLLMKVATSELYTELMELAVDLGGAAGLAGRAGLAGGSAQERDWAIDHLRSLAGTMAGGTSEIQRDIIAQHALRLPRG